jgi:transposase
MGCVQPHPNKLFFAGVRNEFRFVEDRRADYPVTIMCDVLGVSTAGYYAWRSRPESRRSVANRDLVNDIKRVHRDTSGRYGSFTLLRLPPYAPELNPIENVWEYLRGNYLGHIVWNTYEQIVEACCTAWNAFIHDTERVTSVTTRSWAKVTT